MVEKNAITVRRIKRSDGLLALKKKYRVRIEKINRSSVRILPINHAV